MTGIGQGAASPSFSSQFGLARLCGGGSAPNDVAQGVGFQDRQAWLERQAIATRRNRRRAPRPRSYPRTRRQARGYRTPGVPVSDPCRHRRRGARRVPAA